MATPSAPYKPSFMEKVGARYLMRRGQKVGHAEAADEVHVLNAEEQAALRKIERGAVVRAALAGALSGVICALGAVFAWPLLGSDPDHATWGQKIPYYAVTLTVSTLATVLEIAYLYYDSLKSVHRLAHTAGLDLFPETAEPSAVLRSLVRAALEIPNPPREDARIDPRKETNKFRLLLITLLYKAKVTATGILAKAVIGRFGGRMIARRYLDFVGVPVYAIWDAIVVYRVMREARLRAMGPSAASELATLCMMGVKVTPAVAEAMLRAIGAAVVLSADYHPNHRFFLQEMAHRLGNPEVEVLDSSELFLKSFEALTAGEKLQAARVLAVACAIDGRLVGREVRLYEKAMAAATGSGDVSGLFRLRDALRSGEPVREI